MVDRGDASSPPAPSVTVIVATYNCAATLALCLSSLLAQDFQDFDAWIVGDGCTDDSESVVRAFADPRLQWTNLARNSGSQAAPNNEGLRRATGRFVAYLGHDDLWFPWHLSELIKAIEDTGADFAHALAVNFDRAGPCGASGPPPDGVGYRDHFFPPSSWLHRRELTAKIGGWRLPDALGWAVDFDFSRRAALADAKFAYVPRLSVLKFPSANFSLYASPADGLQRCYRTTMERDAQELEREVLTGLATVMARHPQQSVARFPSDVQALGRLAMISIRRRIVDPWRDTWWLRPALWWLFQRKRRRLRRSRGLDVQSPIKTSPTSAP